MPNSWLPSSWLLKLNTISIFSFSSQHGIYLLAPIEFCFKVDRGYLYPRQSSLSLHFFCLFFCFVLITTCGFEAWTFQIHHLLSHPDETAQSTVHKYLLFPQDISTGLRVSHSTVIATPIVTVFLDSSTSTSITFLCSFNFLCVSDSHSLGCTVGFATVDYVYHFYDLNRRHPTLSASPPAVLLHLLKKETIQAFQVDL